VPAQILAPGLLAGFVPMPITIAIIVVVKAVKWSRRMADERAARIEAEQGRLAELAARADQQHAWVLADDPRGTYGEFLLAAT
jgi:hypothetical protein